MEILLLGTETEIHDRQKLLQVLTSSYTLAFFPNLLGTELATHVLRYKDLYSDCVRKCMVLLFVGIHVVQ